MSPYDNVLSSQIRYGNSFDYSYIPDDVSMNDWNKLLRAAKYARESDHRFKISAFVTKSGRVLSKSTNKRKSHPYVPPRRFSLHAEVAALMNVTDATGSTLYVARIDAFDRLAPARPCLYCVSHMKNIGVDRVVYTTSSTSCESFHLSMVNSPLLIE